MAQLPLTGDEPVYDPQRWNAASNVRTHNCYAYFLQDIDARRPLFPQPGGASALRYLYANRGRIDVERELKRLDLFEPYTCAKVSAAVLADNSDIRRVGRFERCRRGEYKGYLAVDPAQRDGDYHFWVQNADGRWSHKPGGRSVTDRDEANQPIWDPTTASRGRYTSSCGFFCVPANYTNETISAPRAGDVVRSTAPVPLRR